MPNILTRLRINEISAVDKGAGEGVKILMVKRKQRAQQQEATMANAPKSSAMKFFEKLFGAPSARMAADAEVAKATARLASSVKSIVGDASVADKSAMLAQTFGQFQEHLDGVTKALPATADPPTSTGDNDMSPKVLKMLGLAEGASEDVILKALANQRHELDIAKADMTAAEKAFHDELDDEREEEDDEEKKSKRKRGNGEEEEEEEEERERKRKSFRAMSHEQRAAAMEKHSRIPEHVRKHIEENTLLRKRLDALENERELVNLTKRAVEVGLPDTEGATLQKAYHGDKSAIDKLLEFTKSSFAAAKAGGVFKEFGGSGGPTPTTPYDELMAKAQELRKADPKLTIHQAFTKVYTDPANIEIVKRERSDNRPSAA